MNEYLDLLEYEVGVSSVGDGRDHMGGLVGGFEFLPGLNITQVRILRIV